MAVMGSMGANLQVFSKNGAQRQLPRPRLVVNKSIGFLDDQRLVIFPTLDAPPDTLVEIMDTDDTARRTLIRSPVVADFASQNMAKMFCVSGQRSLIVAVHQYQNRQFVTFTDAMSLHTRVVDAEALGLEATRLLSVACSNTGTIVAVGVTGGDVLVLDTLSMTTRIRFNAFAATTSVGVSSVAISPDDRFIAVGPTARHIAGPHPDPGIDPRNGMGVKIWRLSDGSFVSDDGNTGTVRDIAWSSNAQSVAIVRDNRVSTLNVETRTNMFDISTGGSSTITTAPDGQGFAYGDRNLVRLQVSEAWPGSHYPG